MKNNINQYMNSAVNSLSTVNHKNTTSLDSVRSMLLNDINLFIKAGHLTKEYMPEYLTVVPKNSKEKGEYAVYLEFLRQLLLENK